MTYELSNSSDSLNRRFEKQLEKPNNLGNEQNLFINPYPFILGEGISMATGFNFCLKQNFDE
jgi:hypothetical protein